MRRIEGRPRDDAGRRLYWVWAAMIQRCHNPNDKGFVRYGALGVAVCDRWRQSFDAFHADMGLPPDGYTIERKDSFAGYSRDNCVWATRQAQNDNRPRWCIAVEVDGEALNLKQAYKRHAVPGLTYRALHKRITERGWPVSMALLLPVGERHV